MSDIVWYTRLDGKYRVEVERSGDYTAELIIRDGLDGDAKIIHQEPVGLMYGAMFGPDAEDVNYWKSRTIEFIDEREK